MYMSCGIPCTGCARNIINAGIKEIVCRKDYSIMNNPIKSEEIGEISIEMFNEAGVKVRYWN
jgi:deoxycytidylate deaminase